MPEPAPNHDLTEATAVRLATLFSALGDPGRVRLLAALLDDDRNVGELTACAGLSQSAVSHHLRHLRDLRLVRARKQGRYVYYTLDDDHVRELIARGLEHVNHG